MGKTSLHANSILTSTVCNTSILEPLLSRLALLLEAAVAMAHPTYLVPPHTQTDDLVHNKVRDTCWREAKGRSYAVCENILK